MNNFETIATTPQNTIKDNIVRLRYTWVAYTGLEGKACKVFNSIFEAHNFIDDVLYGEDDGQGHEYYDITIDGKAIK